MNKTRMAELEDEGKNCAEIVHFQPLYEYNLNKMQRRYKGNQTQQVKLRRNEQRKAKD